MSCVADPGITGVDDDDTPPNKDMVYRALKAAEGSSFWCCGQMRVHMAVSRISVPKSTEIAASCLTPRAEECHKR